MTSFILSPSNIQDYEWIFFNPVEDTFISPVLSFDLEISNPYAFEIDPLNNDVRYQNRTIDFFHITLTEKWLHKKSFYESLLKYFNVGRNASKIEVSLIEDPSKPSDPSAFKADDYKFVLKFIEKYFITRRFVEKSLKSYIHKYRSRWYDLYANGDSIKKFMRHKLKKTIIKTIHSINKKET